MLTGLSIGNFKAFGETQRVPIKPLTLIFGANSAGKSTILQSMIFARHAMDYEDLDQKTLRGSIDLGGFAQFVHKGKAESVVEWGIDIPISTLNDSAQEKLSPAKIARIKLKIGMLEGVLGVLQLSVETDGLMLLSMDAAHPSRLFVCDPADKTAKTPSAENDYAERGRKSGPMTFWVDGADGINFDNATLRAWFQKQFLAFTGISLSAKDFDFLKKHTEEIFDHPCYIERLLPNGLNKVVDSLAKTNARNLKGAKRSRFLKDFATGVAADYLHEFFDDLFRAVNGLLQRTVHIGPLRWYPPRRLLSCDLITKSGDGAEAWYTILANEEARKRINQSLEALKIPYEVAARVWKTKKDRRLGSMEMRELLLADKRTGMLISARDIGVGISQILPILATAFGSRNKIHLIEQPELHLHPALQAELGDLFIESAIGERRNTFLLETHSEHLILRILRRIRQTSDGTLAKGQIPVRPGDVSVVYVQPMPDGSRVVPLPVTSDGDFSVPWPGGFFAERFQELP